MSGKEDPGARQRRIDAAAKTQFLAALRQGESREDAAAAAGFSLMGFYGARRRDPAFAAQWVEALATAAADERRARAYEQRGEGGACPERSRGEVRIASANRRLHQRRRRRNLRFDLDARAVFLVHFAETCDTKASAAAAGVSESTVHRHRRLDSAFAEVYREALAEGYFKLEAEALRQRLAAQERLREAVDNPPRNGGHAEHGGGGPPKRGACPACGRSDDEGAEFDRIMRLLARHDRKPRRAERGFKPGGRRQTWTFDRAIEELAKRLRGLGLDIPPPPAEEGEN
jgi:hypothetical protein